MNLKENYERFFKSKLNEEPKQEIKSSTIEQKQRFQKLVKICANRYPNAPITLKEGWVWLGGKKYQKFEDFMQKTSLQIQESVRSFSNSQSKRLL